nr:hypothetical protein GCM10020092_051690 [Actinoplanes digitatis]
MFYFIAIIAAFSMICVLAWTLPNLSTDPAGMATGAERERDSAGRLAAKLGWRASKACCRLNSSPARSPRASTAVPSKGSRPGTTNVTP